MFFAHMEKVFRFRKIILASIVLAVFGPTIWFFCIKRPLLIAQPNGSLRDYILTAEKKPTLALAGLLQMLELAHDESLASVVAITQKAWLRKTGQERWDMEKFYDDQRKELMPYFRALGLIDTIQPKKKAYRYLILLGATLSSVRNRLHFAIELWLQGIRFDAMVVLGCQRPLNPEIESVAALFDYHNKILPIRADWEPLCEVPQVEIEMMKMVVDQAIMPEAMRKLPITYIDAPMKTTATGEIVRATTTDTVVLWLAARPTPGDCLVVSNQAYVGYQDAVMRTVIPQDFSVETVGQALDEDVVNCAVILDSLARWLYQELAVLNK